jgi:predicted tellurium resistance membrane protein TerC
MDVLFSAFVTLLIVVAPIGNAPIFPAPSHNMAPAYRSRMAICGVVLATAIPVVFLLAGHWLLETLGIGTPPFALPAVFCSFCSRSKWYSRTSPSCACRPYRISRRPSTSAVYQCFRSPFR